MLDLIFTERIFKWMSSSRVGDLICEHVDYSNWSESVEIATKEDRESREAIRL